MTQADKVEHVIDEEKLKTITKAYVVNVNNIDVVDSQEFEDKSAVVTQKNINSSGTSSIFSIHKHPSNVSDVQTMCESSADAGMKRKDSLVDRVKRLLRVDSDSSEELHNKYRETSKDREEKIKLFEKQLNIKLHSPCNEKKIPLLDSHMSISLLFLTILVLLLLNVFLIFKLTSRVEDLENMLATVHDYVEKVTANVTTTPLVQGDRKNPGIIKGRRSKGKTKDQR